MTEDGINCTFLRDLNNFKYETENTESLESLLKEFFEYYLAFDFSSKAVCLNEAVSVTKPEYNPMYIINPLEKALNVSKNVSLDEVDRFKREAQNAIWTLESQENKDNWGILGLLVDQKKKVTVKSLPYTKQVRLMNVNSLFEDNDESSIEYKNVDVKKQVEDIKKSSKEQLKHLEHTLKAKR